MAHVCTRRAFVVPVVVSTACRHLSSSVGSHRFMHGTPVPPGTHALLVRLVVAVPRARRLAFTWSRLRLARRHASRACSMQHAASISAPSCVSGTAGPGLMVCCPFHIVLRAKSQGPPPLSAAAPSARYRRRRSPQPPLQLAETCVRMRACCAQLWFFFAVQSPAVVEDTATRCVCRPVPRCCRTGAWGPLLPRRPTKRTTPVCCCVRSAQWGRSSATHCTARCRACGTASGRAHHGR
jgi:hypothetical protein